MLADNREDIEVLGIELEKGRYLHADNRLRKQMYLRLLWADALTETKFGAGIADIGLIGGEQNI